MPKSPNRLKGVCALVALLLFFASPLAGAAGGGPGGGEGLLERAADLLVNLNRNTDESFGMLHAVLGDFMLDPFRTADGTPGSLLAAMFKNFNMFVFSVACLWMAYNMLAALAQTMHEGVVLGKRMSTVWMPVRIAFGTASLMPVFGGWAFAQALMVLATLLGISGANSMVNTAVDSTAAFNTTVNPMGSVKQASQLHNMEGFMLKAAACARASKDMDAANGVSVDYPASITTADSGKSLVVKFAGRSKSGEVGETACGQIKLAFSPRAANSLTSSFGFRIGDVNYDAIRDTAMRAHQETIQTVYQEAVQVADGSSPNSSPAQLGTAVGILRDNYAGSYGTVFQTKLASIATAAGSATSSSAIQDGLKNRMKEGGWATLGTWYSTYAEVNEAMNEMLDPVVTFQIGADDDGQIGSTYSDVMNGLEGVMLKAGQEYQMGGSTEHSGTATGNTSLGQWIFGGVLNMMAGTSATGYSNTVNPIILYKNLGDNALTTAQTLYFASKAVESLAGGKEGTSVLGTLGGRMAKLIPGMSFIQSIAEDAGALLMPVLMLMFVSAAVMAFYIPMVPFIQWFAALIQWFTTVIESLIGSTLWAMAHFDSDGEGMGQRTSYGYMYLLNNFSRPIIMTFAFFVASATITVMGTFLFRYFGQAVAGAQGNSLTGLMSIVAFLVIFTVMGLTLINSTFSVMLHLADRMIGWIGGNSSSALGHDVEQKISGVFINAARGVPSSVESAAKKKSAKLAAMVRAPSANQTPPGSL